MRSLLFLFFASALAQELPRRPSPAPSEVLSSAESLSTQPVKEETPSTDRPSENSLRKRAVHQYHHQDDLPSFHYNAPIVIECLDRTTGGDSKDASDRSSTSDPSSPTDQGNDPGWTPFPACAESGRPLTLHYGVDADVACTWADLTEKQYRLLEGYLRYESPMLCRVPARPAPPHHDAVLVLPPPPHDQADRESSSESGHHEKGQDSRRQGSVTQTYRQEYVPLVVALAGSPQPDHLHVSTHMHILLHSVAKKHVRAHDSGVVDSAIAYATSPLAASYSSSHAFFRSSQSSSSKLSRAVPAARVVVGGSVPLHFSIRWLPSPYLPHYGGEVGGFYGHDGDEGEGYGHHHHGLGAGPTGAGRLVYGLLAFVAGLLVAAVYVWRRVLRRTGRPSLGGATPLGHGLALKSVPSEGAGAGSRVSTPPVLGKWGMGASGHGSTSGGWGYKTKDG